MVHACPPLIFDVKTLGFFVVLGSKQRENREFSQRFQREISVILLEIPTN